MTRNEVRSQEPEARSQEKSYSMLFMMKGMLNAPLFLLASGS
ncbi:MAG: hypothetical protein QOD00_888 [Blastocatellia bacterium]|jgi:hypothetical protein|nr:hypothetical protein [Blastocatellia bacterium]